MSKHKPRKIRNYNLEWAYLINTLAQFSQKVFEFVQTNGWEKSSQYLDAMHVNTTISLQEKIPGKTVFQICIVGGKIVLVKPKNFLAFSYTHDPEQWIVIKKWDSFTTFKEEFKNFAKK